MDFEPSKLRRLGLLMAFGYYRLNMMLAAKEELEELLPETETAETSNYNDNYNETEAARSLLVMVDDRMVGT